MVMSSTVMVAYRFRGYEYHVTLGVGEEKLKEVMTIEVEDDATADQWKGTFTADYIQGTKSCEQFDVNGFGDILDGQLLSRKTDVSMILTMRRLGPLA